MLNSVITNTTESGITPGLFILCTLVALGLGILIACLHMYHNVYNKNFILTLALLPTIVQAIIMLVNGNLGTGVAVMGAFGLIRFRSVPGNSREICSIFIAMAVGLAAGMGYLGIGALLLLFVAIATLLFVTFSFGEMRIEQKELKITIPENLDYNGIFDDLFATYTKKTDLLRVRTVNMGSMYELQYLITLKTPSIEKAFIDDLRCRNGNLNIACGRVASGREEL